MNKYTLRLGTKTYEVESDLPIFPDELIILKISDDENVPKLIPVRILYVEGCNLAVSKVQADFLSAKQL